MVLASWVQVKLLSRWKKTGEYDSAVAAGVGVIVGILDKFGAGKVIPAEKLATMTGQEIVEELLNKGFVEAAADVGNRIARSAIGEGTTELEREAAIVSGSALTGGQYTAQELADRGLGFCPRRNYGWWCKNRYRDCRRRFAYLRRRWYSTS